MIRNATDTVIDDPSASTTRAYRENTLIPGPIVDCAMSTGAILPDCINRTASGKFGPQRRNELSASGQRSQHRSGTAREDDRRRQCI